MIPLVKHHNHNFEYLVDRKNSILSKLDLIRQNIGALTIIALMLATVLGPIGEEFISRLMRKNDKLFFQ